MDEVQLKSPYCLEVIQLKKAALQMESQRLSAMTNRANRQAKLHNDALRTQGLTRNSLAKGTPLPTR